MSRAIFVAVEALSPSLRESSSSTTGRFPLFPSSSPIASIGMSVMVLDRVRLDIASAGVEDARGDCRAFKPMFMLKEETCFLPLEEMVNGSGVGISLGVIVEVNCLTTVATCFWVGVDIGVDADADTEADVEADDASDCCEADVGIDEGTDDLGDLLRATLFVEGGEPSCNRTRADPLS